jgi:putative ABC transport system substrate-binding protein
MRRREFITLLSGAAAVWPLAARAQQRERMRRLAVLNGTAPTGQNPAAYAGFLRRLGELGWTDGRNVQVEVRWANSDPELMRVYGTELAGHSPDVFLVQSNPALAALRPLAGNTPIVFVHVADPVGSGFVASLARPGSNITGFTNFEPSVGSKWLQTLKQVAPDVTHAAALFHPETPANVAFWREAEAAAQKVGINVVAAGVHDASEVERAITAVAAQSNGGLREVGGYAARILKGAKPIDLPILQASKFELTINAETARLLNLNIPPTLLARADEIIE